MDKTVLLLEADAASRSALMAALEERSYRVLVAATGAEASRLMEREPLHLIILDRHLPDVDGESWLAGLRERGNHVRAIFSAEARADLRGGGRLGDKVEHLIGRSRPPRRPQQAAELQKTLATLGADYGKRLPGKLESLARAIAQARNRPDDAALLREASAQAHRIRGTAGSYGFARVGEEMRRIETVLNRLADLAGQAEQAGNAGQRGQAGNADHEETWLLIEEALGGARFLLQGLVRPGQPPQQQRSPGQAQPQDDLPADIGICRVLLADDDPDFLAAAAAMARQRLVHLQTAHGPGEALAVARALPPDAAILSLDLGEGRGEAAFPLARQLRGLPGCESLPLAFVSRSGEHRVAATHRGASLYLVKPVSEHTFAAAIQQLISTQRLSRPHVLLMDDDEEFARLAAALLRSEGMTVTLEKDPARLLERLEEARPDLLLLDVMLPGPSGFDLCRMLRTTLEWQALPILFLTAESGLASRTAAFEAGGDDYLIKPVLKEEFLARIKVRVERARLLRDRADRDSLTGLLLRRSFLEGLSARLLEARRHCRPLSLCLLDLDRFKRINDRYGHLAGDRLLIGFSQLLSSRLRSEDLRGRWGGEEFILAVPGVSAEVARGLVERVLEELSALRFTGDRGEEFQATCSAGVASFPTDGAGAEELLKAADRRLYAAKEAGRDRVVASG